MLLPAAGCPGMDARREAAAPRSGALKWLLRHRRCRPMTAGGLGAAATREMEALQREGCYLWCTAVPVPVPVYGGGL